MSDRKMPQTLRLTKTEEKDTSRKAIEINKILIEKGKKPMMESELLHAALKLSLKKIKVDDDGNLYIQDE